MANPVFRNPDKLQVLPFRDLIRNLLPPGPKGMTVEDLDLVLLPFGPLLGRPYSADGRFMLVEVKNVGYGIGYPQKRLFKLMDRLLREADPEREFYAGFYILHWNYDTNLPVDINGVSCGIEEFKLWATGAVLLDSYCF